jgi:dCMP deaminase
MKWTKRFLELAQHIAQWSHDPSTKVGAVIVDNRHRIISVGYNGFPRGVLDAQHRYDHRETKLLFVCHAERNALDNSPMSVEGCIMYVPLMPCNECAKSIIQRGIKKVVSYTPTRQDVFNWNITKKMFDEAGVELWLIDQDFDDDYDPYFPDAHKSWGEDCDSIGDGV